MLKSCLTLPFVFLVFVVLAIAFNRAKPQQYTTGFLTVVHKGASSGTEQRCSPSADLPVTLTGNTSDNVGEWVELSVDGAECKGWALKATLREVE